MLHLYNLPRAHRHRTFQSKYFLSSVFVVESFKEESSISIFSALKLGSECRRKGLPFTEHLKDFVDSTPDIELE